MSAKEMLAEIKQRGLIKAGNIQDELNALAVSQEEEIISLNQQLSAKAISEQNIINAFGISGEGAHSKMVIEYVHGLVAERDALAAENACLKQDIDTIAEVMETGTDGALFSAVEEAAGLDTPVTDSVLARIKASELDDLARSIMEYAPVIESDEYHVYEVISKDVSDRAANLRAGRKG